VGAVGDGVLTACLERGWGEFSSDKTALTMKAEGVLSVMSLTTGGSLGHHDPGEGKGMIGGT